MSGEQDATLIDTLIEEGLTLYGASKPEEAIAVWQHALTMAPGNLRILDYLESAGASLDLERPAQSQEILPVDQLERLSPSSVAAQIPAVRPTSDNARGLRQSFGPAITRAAHTGPVRSITLEERNSRQTKRRDWGLWAAIAAGGFVLLGLGGVVVNKLVASNEVASSGARQPAPASASSFNPKPPTRDSSQQDPSKQPSETVSSTEYFEFEVIVSPKHATITVDDEINVKGHLVARLPINGRVHVLRAQAPGYSPAEFTFVDVEPPTSIVLNRLTKPYPKSRAGSTRAGRKWKSDKSHSETKRTSKRTSKQQPSPRNAKPESDNKNPW